MKTELLTGSFPKLLNAGQNKTITGDMTQFAGCEQLYLRGFYRGSAEVSVTKKGTKTLVNTEDLLEFIK